MARPSVLFLPQRLPYPPNKGEKIRSFQILKHLAERFDVHVATLVDDPDDAPHVETLRGMCASLHVERLDRRTAYLRALPGYLRGAPLSFAYFRSAGLQAWVDEFVARMRPEICVISSSNMAPYLLASGYRPPCIIGDFVDVDSYKWAQYAATTRPPMRWVYAREARLVLREERAIAVAVDEVTFVSEEEATLFARLHPAQAGKVESVGNGVDTAYFDPALSFASPYDGDAPTFVFTGTMDYWPNVDAVRIFADEVLPIVQARLPGARFAIVGASPAPAVAALAERPGVIVTGRVADVRPWVAHADVAVAPMQIARGIQNKVLEAMAMGKAAVVSEGALTGIDAEPGTHLIRADDPAAAAEACLRLIADKAEAERLGRAARALVVDRFSWPAKLAVLDRLIDRHLAAR